MSKYCCTVCNVFFSLKKNLARHFKSKHPEDEVKKYYCEICDYSATRKDNLFSHKTHKHRPNFEEVNLSEISNKKSRKSMDSSEISSLKSRKSVIACAMCDHRSTKQTFMLEHYKLQHDITLAEKESLTFSREDEFLDWKLSVENSDKNNFVLKRGKTRAADGKTKSTFHCFRDGYFKSRGSNVRREKMSGSNKINGHCPAKMEVITLPTGEVKVEFFKTHVGHQNEVKRMRLSKGERDEVAKNIASKIPFENILDNLRATLSNDEVQRRDLITLKDMHNIARDYNLKAERKVKPKISSENPRRKRHKVFLKLDVSEDEREHNDLFTHEQEEWVPQDIILSDMQNEEMVPGIDFNRKKDLIMNHFLSLLHEANSEDDLELISKMIEQTQATMHAQNSVQHNSMF